MNHRQRIEACIHGQSVDRPPVALWRHFPVDDQDPTLLADAVINFQLTYDFDFVKVTPASTFCIKDYSVLDDWKGNPEGTRLIAHFPVQEPSDWENLQPLAPNAFHLQSQLDCLRMIRERLPEDTPVIQTIFDPLSQAKNLVGKDQLLIHLHQEPEKLLLALEVLASNTVNFIQECIKIGVDGVFFAIQHAQSAILDPEELAKFILPLDARILNSANCLLFNIIHIHGTGIYFKEIMQLPSNAVNWHDQETAPNLREGKKYYPGAVCGGLRQWHTLAYGTSLQVASEAKSAIIETGGDRFILGTGCVLPIITPHGNILAARRAVER